MLAFVCFSGHVAATEARAERHRVRSTEYIHIHGSAGRERLCAAPQRPPPPPPPPRFPPSPSEAWGWACGRPIGGPVCAHRSAGCRQPSVTGRHTAEVLGSSAMSVSRPACMYVCTYMHTYIHAHESHG